MRSSSTRGEWSSRRRFSNGSRRAAVAGVRRIPRDSRRARPPRRRSVAIVNATTSEIVLDASAAISGLLSSGSTASAMVAGRVGRHYRSRPGSVRFGGDERNRVARIRSGGRWSRRSELSTSFSPGRSRFTVRTARRGCARGCGSARHLRVRRLLRRARNRARRAARDRRPEARRRRAGLGARHLSRSRERHGERVWRARG